MSRVATGEVNADGPVDVIVAHRESVCAAVLPGCGDARIDQLFGSR